MHEDDPVSFNRMLIYLYTNDYPAGEIPPEERPSIDNDCSTSPYLSALMSTLAVSERSNAAEPSPVNDELLNHTRVYAIAHKYNIPSLKELAIAKFSPLIQSRSPWSIAPIMNAVFETTPSSDTGLRDLIIQICADNIDRFMMYPTIIAVFKNEPDLTLGVLLERHELERQTPRSEASVLKEMKNTQKAQSEANRIKDSTIEKLTSERDAALRREAYAIQEKNTALEAKQKASNSESDALNERNQMHRSQSAALDYQSLAVKERDAALAAKANALAQKDSAYKKLNVVTKERDAALRSYSGFVSRLDELLRKTFDWGECRNCGLDFDSYIQRFGGNQEFRLQLRCIDCGCRHDLGAGRD